MLGVWREKKTTEGAEEVKSTTDKWDVKRVTIVLFHGLKSMN